MLLNSNLSSKFQETCWYFILPFNNLHFQFYDIHTILILQGRGGDSDKLTAPVIQAYRTSPINRINERSMRYFIVTPSENEWHLFPSLQSWATEQTTLVLSAPWRLANNRRLSVLSMEYFSLSNMHTKLHSIFLPPLVHSFPPLSSCSQGNTSWVALICWLQE